MHPRRYRITIEGDLGRAGRTAFEEFTIACNDGHTSLVADLDQPALYGGDTPAAGSGRTLTLPRDQTLCAPPGCVFLRGLQVPSGGNSVAAPDPGSDRIYFLAVS